MRKILHFKLFYLLILFLVLPLCSAQASITFNASKKFNGNGTTYNTGTWVSISIVDKAPGQVDLTISAVGLSGGEKIGGIYLNLDPSLDPAALSFSAPTMTGAFEAPSIGHASADGQKADGDGLYDILFAFNPDGPNLAFNGGESVEYTVSMTGLSASSFNFLSVDGGGMGNYLVAVDIRSPGGVSGTTVWATTPEPATITLMGLGVLSLLKRQKEN